MTNNRRPQIGITRGSASPESLPDRYRWYHDCISEAGGDPVDLHPSVEKPGPSISGIHGFVFTGGPDLDPTLYGTAKAKETSSPERDRDEFEISVMSHALKVNLPLLAVCRGHQLLNVASGGSLLQHIEGHVHSTNSLTKESRFHEITICPGSVLEAILKTQRARVNSRHHQAITQDRLGPGLNAIATSDDGIVEAISSATHKWVIGVQWHPEREEVRESFVFLFTSLVAAAAETMQVSE